jgi:membrane-associated phospholipid phosphatase
MKPIAWLGQPSFAGVARLWWWLPLALLALGSPLWLHAGEPDLFLTLNGWGAPVAAPVWTGLSLLGNGWGVLGITAPLLVLAPRVAGAWVCAAPFAILFSRAGKWLIDSPRPAALIDPAQFRVIGEVLQTVSMPSGHTTTAFAVASAMWFALWQHRHGDPQDRLQPCWRHAWLPVLALAVGLSRIAVGAHWPGDVLVGMALGLWSGLLGNALLQALPATAFTTQSWSLRALALLMAFAVYTLWNEPQDFAENLPFQRLLAVLALASLCAFAMRSARALRAS